MRFDDGFFEGGCEDDDLFDRCLDDGCFDGGCEDGGCEDDRLFVACPDDVCFDDVRFDDGFFDSRCEDGWCEDDGCFDDELFDDVFLNDRRCGSHSAIGNRQSALFKAGVRHGRCGVGRDRRRFQDGRQKVEGFHRRFFDRRRNRINADRLTREDLLIAGFLREAVELLRQIDVQLAVGDGFRRRAGCRRQFILDEGDNLILDGGGNLILDGGGSRQLFDRFDRRRRFDRFGRPHLDRFDRRCWFDRFGRPHLERFDHRRFHRGGYREHDGLLSREYDQLWFRAYDRLRFRERERVCFCESDRARCRRLHRRRGHLEWLRGADRNGPGRGGLVELRLQLCAFRSRFAQVGIDLLGEDRRFAAVGRRRFGAATPPLGEHASRLRKLRAVGQNRNRQRADIRGGGDHAQGRGQRRIVLRREERGHQHHIRDAVADRVERALGRFREDELGRDLLPDDSGQVGGLPPIRFDRENDGHPTFAA